MKISVETRGEQRGWIAEITGKDPKYKLAREFMGERDYSQADQHTGEGAITTAELQEGQLYEINAPHPDGTERYFATVVEDALQELSFREVMERLEAREATSEDHS